MSRPDSRRALRRHHRARVIRNRMRQYRFTVGDDAARIEPGRVAWAPVSRWCSCWLCSAAPVARTHYAARWWEDGSDERLPTRLAGARASASS